MHNTFSSLLITFTTLLSLVITPLPRVLATTRLPQDTAHAMPRSPQLPSHPGINAIGQPKALCSPSVKPLTGATTYEFTAIGTCDWTVPPTVTGIELLIIAGGGGGGWGAGGGGGGGQVISIANLSVTPGTSIAITVGAAGSYGYTSTMNGRVGGSSAVTIATVSTTTTGW